MITRRSLTRLTAVAACSVATLTGCAFHGLNSLPLPGTVGRGPDAAVYHVELANIGTLESNSPVMIGDVIVGSISRMVVRGWHADVEVSVKPDVVVPANAVATVGQTSLLGSMHIALDPPPGQSPSGRLGPGATLEINRTSTYPSTEQTLSSLSVLVNGGGLGKIGDVVTEFNAALNGRQDQIRDLLTRLDDIVGMFADQRDDINASITALNRLSGTLAGQQEVITTALQRIPPALDVLIKERPRITTALEKFGHFSDTATKLVNATRDDLVTNLRNLEPTVRALADVGPNLGTVLAFAPTYPYPQNFIDRAIRGDYLNQFITFDFTVPRLKRGLFLGTRWGQEGLSLTPAPGDPFFANYTKDPLNMPLTPPPPAVATIPPLVEAAPVNGQSAQAAPAVSAPAPSPEPMPASPAAVVPSDPAAPNGGGN
ncbi:MULTISPECIES: MCE family protein [unclassified Mycolicibacterium]|uniref:MCE family protein n=1 Tax=unclassified Mycolicibacterium TaxID=2636767 RepID=UPI0012DD13E5|nr:MULTISPECIES: MCE family protein [unclassified Mycolicibacterium]MUL81873.1 MCE family protein [Mycolicibacterium sp. CBMA 329]MUL87639.1 MCE family protein [Mycolicibacterium sp. CBMA 331]MUL99497.1 MCE family protein [Mycolicibacterium sp. CBMA 334]MUM26417.1 MCE family protein [Mycolicibacterium sp. CBMA 295]MUM37936.1 MCE family protein [Mycolicibacterium sp. CBMA 247]